MQKLIIIIVLIAAAAQLAYAKSQDDLEPKSVLTLCSVTGATTDLLMSDDMGKYLANEGRGQVLGEEDME